MCRQRKKSLEPVFVNVYGSQASIPPAYVAWRGGTSKRVVVPTTARQAGNRFLGSLQGFQIRAQSFVNSSSEPVFLNIYGAQESIPGMNSASALRVVF